MQRPKHCGNNSRKDCFEQKSGLIDRFRTPRIFGTDVAFVGAGPAKTRRLRNRPLHIKHTVMQLDKYDLLQLAKTNCETYTNCYWYTLNATQFINIHLAKHACYVKGQTRTRL